MPVCTTTLDFGVKFESPTRSEAHDIVRLSKLLGDLQPLLLGEFTKEVLLLYQIDILQLDKEKNL